MNLHGVATVESATMYEDEDYEEPVTVTPAAATAAEPAAAGGEAPMEAEPAEAAAAAGTDKNRFPVCASVRACFMQQQQQQQ